MKCNNAKVKDHNGIYSITLPDDKKAEKNEVLKEAVEKYNGYCYIEITRVHRPKTLKQNRLFHALHAEYYKSGCHSSNSWDGLRDALKYRYGTSKQTLIDDNIVTILKSIGDYTLEEYTPLIDGTISEMHQTGVDSKKFYEILEGIE